MDLVRIYLGMALFFKGIYFMANREYLLQILDEAGSWSLAPVAIAHYIVLAHLFGGVLLAVGLLTRFAAAAQIPILVFSSLPQANEERLKDDGAAGYFEKSRLVDGPGGGEKELIELIQNTVQKSRKAGTPVAPTSPHGAVAGAG